jgi:hypothetical protein
LPVAVAAGGDGSGKRFTQAQTLDLDTGHRLRDVGAERSIVSR